MYIITAAIAGWALNKNIDSSAGAGGYVGTCRENKKCRPRSEEVHCLPPAVDRSVRVSCSVSSVGLMEFRVGL